MRRIAKRLAAVGALSAMALLGGCADNSGPQDLSGTWGGTLTLRFAGGGSLAGGLTLVLDQAASAASGTAEWGPIGETQGIAGPLDGIFVTLNLLFRCEERFERTVLTGTVSGDRLEIDDASGKACTLGGASLAVEGGEGSLTRTSDDRPL